MVKMLTQSKIEYVDWGLNWIDGCVSACGYCYMQTMARRFNATDAATWARPRQRFEDPAGQLEHLLGTRREMPEGVLMLSTVHDPAQDVHIARQMAALVDVLVAFGLAGQALLLTKHPAKALGSLRGGRARNAGLRFGASITSLRGVNGYEPGAEPAALRLAALLAAQESGYRTWVSIEPPLPGVRLSDLVAEVLTWPGKVRPWIVLGKMNATGGELGEWSRSEHWAGDRDAAVRLLEGAGFVESLQPVDGGYWVKRELAALRG